jgi:hypothetical protein
MLLLLLLLLLNLGGILPASYLTGLNFPVVPLLSRRGEGGGESSKRLISGFDFDAFAAEVEWAEVEGAEVEGVRLGWFHVVDSKRGDVWADLWRRSEVVERVIVAAEFGAVSTSGNRETIAVVAVGIGGKGVELVGIVCGSPVSIILLIPPVRLLVDARLVLSAGSFAMDEAAIISELFRLCWFESIADNGDFLVDVAEGCSKSAKRAEFEGEGTNDLTGSALNSADIGAGAKESPKDWVVVDVVSDPETRLLEKPLPVEVVADTGTGDLAAEIGEGAGGVLPGRPLLIGATRSPNP